jgi:hypothetical protein
MMVPTLLPTVLLLLLVWLSQVSSDVNGIYFNASTHSQRKTSNKSIVQSGAAQLIPGVTIHGAVIVSDKARTIGNPNLKEVERALAAIDARQKNVEALQRELPFPLTHWSAVYVHPCPIFPYGHKTERGLMWAHFRIIREFAYFDPVLLAKANYQEGRTPIVKKPLVSKDGIYRINTYGALFKNNQPFLDTDIITIFEDDVESTINEMNVTIIEEFRAMKEDVLYLGWCDGVLAKPVPLCAHAYAFTRRGARKFVQLYEPCGRALDEQLVIMAKNNFITWRKAFKWSYANLNEKYRTTYGLKTCGMFHQNKGLGSINGH